MMPFTRRRRGARAVLGWACVPALTLVMVLGPRGFADSTTPPSLELDLRDVPLVTAINMLIAQSGAEISFVDPQSKLEGRKVELLSARPHNVDEALQKICRAAGCYFEKEPGGEYVISPEPLTPSKSASEREPSPMPAAAVDNLPQTEEIQSIKLQYMDCRDVLNMLENFTPVSNGRVLSGLPRETQQLKDLEIVPGTFDGTTGNYIAPSFAQPEGRGVLGTGAGTLGTGAGQFFGGGFPGGTPGGGGFTPGGIGAGGAPGAAGTAGAGGGLVPPNIVGIYAFPLDNSLIVRGDPDAIQDLQRVIRLLDIPAKQIQIKVEQIRIETSLTKAFGIDWEAQNNNVAVQTNIGNSSGGNINVAFAGTNFRANLSALLTTGKATVIDSATVSTMNNVPAIITAFSQSYYFIPFRQQIQGAGLVTTYQPTPLVIPTTLTAIPRVNGDGTITMFIPFSISRPTGQSVGPDGTTLPNQVGTQLAVLRRVPSGATVVIGALDDKSDSDTVSRIPLLSDLPIIGPLFRSKQNIRNDGETLFFFTPTLLPDLPGQSEASP